MWHADVHRYPSKGVNGGDRREALTFGGQHPWSAQGGGPGGLKARGGQHMSAQVTLLLYVRNRLS